MTPKNERGATAVLIALCLVLLMGMAAFAVDISAGKNERRLDQNGADSSVLAGALEYALGGSAQQIVDEVKTYVNTNVRTVSNTEWSACTDTASLPVLSSSIPGVTGGTPCISFRFDPDDQLLRVRLPNQSTPTSFGRVIGFNNLTTFAAAEARIFETSNGAYPTGVLNGVGPGAEICIKTGPAAGKDSCGASTTGDFGNFNPYFYTELGGGSLCTSGNQPQPLARSIADGLDHRLGTTPTAPGNRVNGANCPQFPGPLNPNRVDPGGGYSNNDITNGLIKGESWPGSNAFTGRLTRTNADGSFTFFQNYPIDNKPLWEYIDSAQATTTQCQTAATLSPNPADPVAVRNAETTMKACLAAETDLLFLDDVADTTRLITVPQYHQSAPLGSNACCYDIRRFVPVFIQGLWTNHGGQWTCTGVFVQSGAYCLHEPGMNGSIHINANGQQKVDSASGLVLNCIQLPEPICATIGAGGSGESLFYELELTR